MCAQVGLETRLAIDRVEVEQSLQMLAHCRVGMGLLETGPAAEGVLRLSFQSMRGFRQAGVPDLPGTLMHNVLHGMP
jgi:hypothetical protein